MKHFPYSYVDNYGYEIEFDPLTRAATGRVCDITGKYYLDVEVSPEPKLGIYGSPQWYKAQRNQGFSSLLLKMPPNPYTTLPVAPQPASLPPKKDRSERELWRAASTLVPHFIQESSRPSASTEQRQRDYDLACLVDYAQEFLRMRLQAQEKADPFTPPSKP